MLQEWTEDVILSYIANQTKENLESDYKRSDALQNRW